MLLNVKDDDKFTVTLNITTGADKSIDPVKVQLTAHDGKLNPDESEKTYQLLGQGQKYKMDVDIPVSPMEIRQGQSTVTGSDNTSLTTAVGKSTVDSAALGILAANVVKTEIENLETLEQNAEELMKEAQIDETGDINFIAKPHLNIAIGKYEEGNNKNLSLDISAVCEIIATKQSNVSDVDDLTVYDPDHPGNENDYNAVLVDNRTLTVDEPITLTVGVPNGFFTQSGPVYIQHSKDDWKTRHCHKSAPITADADTVTFTSSDGLSSFVISEKTEVEASIDGTYYDTLADAVAAAETGNTIVLQKSNVSPVEVNRTIKLTVRNESGVTNDLEDILKAGSGVKMSCDGSNEEGYVTYTFEGSGTGNGNGSNGGSNNGSSGSSSASYTVGTASTTNGSFTVSDRYASVGKTVTITPKPNDGYIVDTVKVTDKNGNSIKVTKNADGTYSFVMPEKSAQPVKVEVTFKEDDGTGDHPSAKFTDVVSGAWYQTAVDYVIANGLMEGTSDTTFEPNTTTSRGMVVTILYRLEGTPSAAASGFPDVAAGQWYTDAVSWAAANGIVTGYDNGNFGPNDIITREQMATILYRYASHKAYGTGAQANLASYTDASAISGYAESAMKWANAEGLITGTTTTTLSPAGDASRAEVATILMRFCEEVVK